jgi:signal transduction histidine kinase
LHKAHSYKGKSTKNSVSDLGLLAMNTRLLDGVGQISPVRGGRRNQSVVDDLLVMPMDVSVSKAEHGNDWDFTHVLRDCLNGGVLVVDARGKVTGFNPRVEALLPGPLRGKTAADLPAPIAKLIQKVLASRKPVTGREFALPGGVHGHLVVRASATPMAVKGGKPSGVVVTLNDISTAGKWEANIRRLDRLHSVGTLSASMAHEVKNAFVAVRTFVDLLLEQNKNADLAEVVRMEMNRIDAILGQMRKFAGPLQPNFSTVRLNFVMDKSLTLIQHLLEQKKIKVTRSLKAANDLLQGDPDQLEQAFINLLFNALDAMKPNGKLAISTEMLATGTKIDGLTPQKDQPLVRVAIHDDGPGILPEHLARLFEPFFTTKADGTGLGLAITRRIIREHHGAITVQSEPHKGTTFNLFLPTTGTVS